MTSLQDVSTSPGASVVVVADGATPELERTFRSLGLVSGIEGAEVLVGLYGEDGVPGTRSLAVTYLPSTEVRIRSLPNGSAADVEAIVADMARSAQIAFVPSGSEAPADLLTQPRPVPVRRPFTQIRTPRALKLLLVANALTAAVYVSWWLQPGHVGTTALFVALAVVEAFTLLHVLGLWWTVWSTRIDPPPRTVTGRTVDVFVTTYGEPLDVLERTVAGAVAMRGEHRTFVLDDAGRLEVALLARRHGAEYVARSSRHGAKAGNLNNALGLTDGELVCVFDADHVPHPDFLERTLGYFEDERLAFVQTPQVYANARDEEIARGAYQQQAIFYGPICRGKSGLNAAFCCGTNVVFRRAALEDAGGFDERSVVEDFVTSMRVHARGWGSVYYPLALSDGLGPPTLSAYFRQQFRWARGSVGALATGEPFRRGLSLQQRLQYLLATTFYLVGLVTPVYIVLPILYLVAGWSAFSPSSGEFVLYYAPYLTLGLLTLRFGLGGSLRLEHLRYTFGAFPVYAVASLAALLHLPARFTVTGSGRRERRAVPPLAWVSVAAFAATAAAIAIGLAVRPADPATFTNVSWALVNLLLLAGIVTAALREPLRRTSALRTRLAALAARPSALSARVVERVAGGRRELAAVGALTALALVLRAALVDVQSLRLDESLSLREAALPLGEMVQNLRTWDMHPPLYYTLLHYWLELTGTSAIAARIPSILLGAAAVPLLYVVARRLVDRRAALVAAALGAASPFWVWHSGEARMYPLMLTTSLLALWRLMVASEDGGRKQWALYAVVTAISLYSHYFAALMLPVHLAYLLFARVPRRRLAEWSAAAGAALATFLPWLVALALAAGGVGGVGALNTGLVAPEQDHSPLGALYGIFLFLLVYLVGYAQSLAAGAGVLGVASRIASGSWPLVAVFVALSRRLTAALRSRTTLFLASWIALTIGVVFLLDFWKHNVWLQRYLIVASPAIFILLAAGLSALIKRVAVAAVLVALVTATVVDNLDAGNSAREDWRQAAMIVEGGMHAGDAVVVMPWFYVTPFDYYFHGRLPVVGLLSEERGIAKTANVDLPRLADAHRGRALWVVIAYTETFDPDGTIRRELDRRFERTATYSLGGEMEMRRYEVRAGSGADRPR